MHTFNANIDPDAVDEIAWNVEDNLLAIAGANEVQVWDVNSTPSLSYSFTLDGLIQDVEWSSDSTQLIVGNHDSQVYIWQQNQLVSILNAHTESVDRVAWEADRIVSGASDGTARVWDATTGQLTSTLQAGLYTTSRKAIALSEDGNKLAYADEQAHLKIIQFPTANPGSDQTTTDTDNDGSEFVTLDGTASTDPDGTIDTYEWLENGVVIAEEANPQVVLAAGEHTITLKVTDNDGLVDMAEVMVEVVPEDSTVSRQSSTVINSMAWNPDGTILALGGSFYGQLGLHLIDGRNGRIIQHFEDPYSAFGVSWRPDGKQIASVNGVGEYTIRNAQTGSIISIFSQTGATSDQFIHWNPANYNQIATVERDIVLLRDVSNGEVQATLDGPGGKPDSVLSVGWSLDGMTLYTVSNDSLIRIWDVDTATLLNEISFNFGAQAFAMSLDHTQLAIAGGDEVIRIYDVSGALLTSFGGLPVTSSRTDIVYLQWHPDGTQVAGADNKGIHVWDIQNGKLVVSVPHRTSYVIQEAMAFNPDGALTIPSGNATSPVLLAPIADPGSDQILTNIDNDGSEFVTLDGTASTDPDGTIDTYEWLEDGIVIAEGENPQVELEVGEHTITLKVTDNDGLVDMADMVIEVVD